MEEAAVMMVGLSAGCVLQGLRILDTWARGLFQRVMDYGKPHVADKGVRIIVSYVGYVARTLWADHNEMGGSYDKEQ